MADANYRIRVTCCERPDCFNLIRQKLSQGRPKRYCNVLCRARRRPKAPRIEACSRCGSDMTVAGHAKLYCSKPCQKAAECQRRKERRAERGEHPHLLEAKRERRRSQSTEPAYVLRERLRNAIKKAVRRAGVRATWSKSRVLAFSDAELVEHFERLFKPGMSWSNFGEWHVDHVRPLASFDATEADMREANRLENLRPMWAAENIAKGSFYGGERYRYAT